MWTWLCLSAAFISLLKLRPVNRVSQLIQTSKSFICHLIRIPHVYSNAVCQTFLLISAVIDSSYNSSLYPHTLFLKTAAVPASQKACFRPQLQSHQAISCLQFMPIKLEWRVSAPWWLQLNCSNLSESRQAGSRPDTVISDLFNFSDRLIVLVQLRIVTPEALMFTAFSRQQIRIFSSFYWASFPISSPAAKHLRFTPAVHIWWPSDSPIFLSQCHWCSYSGALFNYIC